MVQHFAKVRKLSSNFSCLSLGLTVGLLFTSVAAIVANKELNPAAVYGLATGNTKRLTASTEEPKQWFRGFVKQKLNQKRAEPLTEKFLLCCTIEWVWQKAEQISELNHYTWNHYVVSSVISHDTVCGIQIAFIRNYTNYQIAASLPGKQCTPFIYQTAEVRYVIVLHAFATCIINTFLIIQPTTLHTHSFFTGVLDPYAKGLKGDIFVSSS